MIFYTYFLVLVIVFSIINAAIIIQAPKYVPKRTLQNLVRKYYLQLTNRGRFDKGLEIEIPISRPISQQYRYPRPLRRPVEKSSRISRRQREVFNDSPASTVQPAQPPIQVIQPQILAAPALPWQLLMPPASIYNPSGMQYGVPNDNLRRAEEAVKKHLKASRLLPKRRSGVLSREIYQEDLQKALDKLEARLKAGGNRPATMDDLVKMIDEFEKKILEKQEVLATSTPEPCGEEDILVESLKPALKKDLWEAMSLAQKNCGGATKFAQPMEDTHRGIQLTIKNQEEDHPAKMNSHEILRHQTRRNIGEEILDLLEDDFETSTSRDLKSFRRSMLSEQLLELLQQGVAVEENPRALEDKGLIPIKIEVPKSFKDIIINA